MLLAKVIVVNNCSICMICSENDSKTHAKLYFQNQKVNAAVICYKIIIQRTLMFKGVGGRDASLD